jgi:endonuclease G, mitochondrial
VNLFKSRIALISIALVALVFLTGCFWWLNRSPETPIDSAKTGVRTEGNLALGNPSKAGKDPNNYLLTKKQYSISYNNSKHIPNWVSWKLTAADIGAVPRRNNFDMDTSLPQGWYQVKSSDYSGSGYDRGHMCPAADRSANVEDNTATFILSNIIPQARDNNQGPWADLEGYTRDQVKQGKEAYIISGGYGQKGVLAKGKVAIPAHTWKVIVFTDKNAGGAAGVTDRTRIIAVDLPNEEGIKTNSWKQYLTTVRDLESKTGYDFLSDVPKAIQDKVETQSDRN